MKNLNDSYDPEIVINENFKIVYANEYAKLEYGEIIGKNCYQVFNGFNSPCFENVPYVCPVKLLTDSDNSKFSGLYMFNSKKNKYISLSVHKKDGVFIMKQRLINQEYPEILDLEKILDVLHEGTIVIREDKDIEFINKKFIEILQINKEPDYFKKKSVNILKKFLPKEIKDLFSRSKELPENEDLIVHFSDRYLVLKKYNISKKQTFWSLIEKKEMDLGDEIFRVLLETTPVGIFLQCSGRFMYVNPTMASILETTPGDLIGSSIFKYVHPEDSNKVSQIINRREEGEQFTERYTIRVITGDGNEKWVEIRSETIFFKGKICGIGSVIDITKHKKMEENLRKLATVDQLTNIYNRYAFEKFLEEEINKAERYGFKFAILMFDIDNFKSVNDIYGHQVGDRVLRQFVDLVKKNIRKSDVFARWGGEEFMILAPIKKKEDAYKIAEKIRKSIENFTFDHIQRITVSIGISFFRQGDTIKSLIRRADTALYQAKKLGKNMTVIAD